MNIACSKDFSLALSRLGVVGANWARIGHSGHRGFSLPAGNAVAMHIVLSGTIDIQIAGRSEPPTRLRMGDAAILLTGAAHSVRSAPGLPVERLDHFQTYHGLDSVTSIDLKSSDKEANSAISLVGMLYLSDLPGWLDRDLVPSIVSSIRQSSIDAEMRAALLDETSRSRGGNVCLTKFAEMMMVRVCRDLMDSCSELEAGQQGAHAKKIARAIRMIKIEPGRHWTVGNMAEAVGMSRSAFAEKFLIETGQTPMEAVLACRMDEAVRLLERPDVRVKEVAARIGYHSESAFSRRFARTFGVAPATLRQQSVKPAAASHQSVDPAELSPIAHV